MTNKDYKRLTRKWETSLPTELTPCVHIHDRLWKLENAIDDGTLVFLPCKVGDKFWWLYQRHDGSFVVTSEEVQAIEITKQGVSIIDLTGEEWYLSEIYFTKEEAYKAWEELKK